MDAGGDTREGSHSSVILESLGSTSQGDKFSDDDLAWVNSCLVNDTEILESNWTSFKDVLLEIIGDHQPEPLDSSVSETNGFLGGTEINIVPSVEDSGRTEDDDLVIPVIADDGTTTDTVRIKKKIGTQLQFLQEDSDETFRGDPFLPTYKEDGITDNAVDIGVQSSLSTEEMNSSIVNIFRVWGLDIPDEESDLMKELKKIVAETTTSVLPVPLAFDDSTSWKGLEDEQLDNLVSGIADLSLNTNMF